MKSCELCRSDVAEYRMEIITVFGSEDKIINDVCRECLSANLAFWPARGEIRWTLMHEQKELSE